MQPKIAMQKCMNITISLHDQGRDLARGRGFSTETLQANTIHTAHHQKYYSWMLSATSHPRQGRTTPPLNPDHRVTLVRRPSSLWPFYQFCAQAWAWVDRSLPKLYFSVDSRGSPTRRGSAISLGVRRMPLVVHDKKSKHGSFMFSCFAAK